MPAGAVDYIRISAPEAILTPVASSFIDLHDEGPALRRAAVLLERVQEDSGTHDADLHELEAGIATMQRAAAAGRRVHRSAVRRMEGVLARVAQQSVCSRSDSIEDILRCNAFAETRELLRRLAQFRREPVQARAELQDLLQAAVEPGC